ncbi:hypothetical protein AMK14_10670 [Streptomyces sp. TSRI0445]|uniref:Uncharacterized protein n=1 Tax=Streptomyces globisporus TaxID=1908 RepID=A0ABN8VGF0_STRGL|nr:MULTISPECIES: hypothetical protein [Streptomyces]PPA41382.1 hypothetical protein BF14_017680 [Streptomyces griseus]RAN18711.1 hypothetical protein A3838_17265 [Streptomyces badius]AWL87529.1 hypothetical protein DIJ69_17675 [Streptomyces globisporus]OKI73615.1 hypothetical protein AMK14_10670 [Streptomyces sp. TSRI0445]RAN26607.1 hypothetical protein A3800_17275 [Streptomyces badius]
MRAGHAAQRRTTTRDPFGAFLSWMWALGTVAGFAALAVTGTAELGRYDARPALSAPDARIPAL